MGSAAVVREDWRVILGNAMREPAAGARRPPVKGPGGVAHSGATGGPESSS